MKCEACGGDGLIEVGAYRGDDSPDTRECRLCGGPKLVVNIPAGTPIDRTVEILKQLSQTATQAGVTLKESTSGSRRTVAVVETQTPHEHSWKEGLFADLVEYTCECSVVTIFSRRDGSLVNPADISEFDKLYLSSRTMTRFPPYEKTAKEHADERLKQLHQENERRQREAEGKSTQGNTIRTHATERLTATYLELSSNDFNRIATVPIIGNRAVLVASQDLRATHVKVQVGTTGDDETIAFPSPVTLRRGDRLETIFTNAEMEIIAQPGTQSVL